MSFYKKIGIIGGLSPESTGEFYRHIIRLHQEHYRDKPYPEIVIYSVDFNKVQQYQLKQDWRAYAGYIQGAVGYLVKAGVDIIVIASNTTHIIAEKLHIPTGIRFIHIATSVLLTARQNEFKKLLLLGTKLTMNSDFYNKQFACDNISIQVPEASEREVIENIIFDELVFGKLQSASRKRLLEIMDNYRPDAVILGCTELGLLLKPDDTSIPLLDSMAAHAENIWKKAKMS